MSKRNSTGSIPPPKKSKNATDEVLTGEDTPLEKLHQIKPTKGSRHMACFLTWSNTKKKDLKSPSDFTKADFARMLATAWDTIRAKDTPVPSMLICEERHQDGSIHFHCIMRTDKKCGLWWQLSECLKNMKVMVDISCTTDKNGVSNMIRYLLCPSKSKPDVDSTPFRTENFVIGTQIIASIEKVKSSFAKRPADGEEIKSYIFENTDITDFRGFCVRVDQSLRNEPDSLFYKLFSAFISKNRDARSIVELSIDRRNDITTVHRTFKEMFLSSYNSDCQCTEKGMLLAATMDSVKFHDGKGVKKNSSNDIAGFASDLINSSFKTRRQTLYLFGVPGSGKSCITQCFVNICDEPSLFTPDFSSAFPFSSMKTHHALSNYNEFRLNPKQSPSTWLLVLERSAVNIDIKGKPSVHIPKPPPGVMSSNILTPNHTWTNADIEALSDRTVHVVWTKRIPELMQSKYGSSVLGQRCKKCSADFICKISVSCHNIATGDTKEVVAQKDEEDPLNEEEMQYLMGLGSP